jgi:hypothetical protein
MAMLDAKAHILKHVHNESPLMTDLLDTGRPERVVHSAMSALHVPLCDLFVAVACSGLPDLGCAQQQ